ncbi:MAG TPA: cytochrome P450 [Actinophytocola sp.]|uniref:cytochrome P450 family protein n=1 Tax=Actinophytocola sp. TaxID=1872138 RepID=UPI002DDD480D|nr:cytochrome P450 [Actinophytocola sp.]HEV2781326.1 cytochrome P450 [Actinophytocola sp.]
MIWTEDFIRDPYTLHRRLREEAPVCEVIMPRGLKVWLVTRYADARDVLADPSLRKDMRQARDLLERHSTAAGAGAEFSQDLAAHMLNSDPPDHTRLRRLVAKAFTMRRVELMRPRIEQITDDLLADFAGRDRVDLVDDFAFPLPVTVICELLGVPYDDRDDFRKWSNAMLSADGVPVISEAIQAMAAYLFTLIGNKRAEPADDMLTALIHVRDEADDRLTELELVSMAFLLLVAGHETTVNLIANGVLSLLRNPDQLAALRADPTLLPGAVEEFLRYESPVKDATLRYTTAPIRVGGVDIPAGEFLLVSLSAANRDGDRFADPDRLDVTRDASGHLAFGHGVHFCLGAPLARLEGQIAIGRLLGRFPDLALATDPAALRWRNSTLLRGLEHLPVRLR